MRTTIDIDDPVLKEVKKLRKAEGKPLGRIISDLLAHAIHARKTVKKKPGSFQWISKGMAAHVQLNDKDALYAILDKQSLSPKGFNKE
ncbi:MAG: antitoxin [Deltaproteobacteria bacterium]|nr:antitoxin [Deltaproteobacteria bacterium]MBW2217909.1 antitoxin [Deltaproteobacteria bacterium]